MKTFKYIIIATIGLLFTISACTKKGDEIERTLELEKNSLILNKDSHVETIKVTVDAGVSFSTTWKGEAWGTATANIKEGVITITVQTNPTSTLRKASIVVTTEGGLRNSIVEITQNGDNPILDIVPDEISFDFMGGEQTVEINSDIKWSANNDVEWLTLNSYVQAGNLVVKAIKNKDILARSTTLTISAGVALKEVVVRQEAAELFIFPYLNMNGATFEEIQAFEEARHNTVLEGSGRLVPTTAYTNSALMPIILYDNMTMASDGLSNPSIFIKDQYMPDFFFRGTDKGKIHDIVKEYGFEFIADRKTDNACFYWLDNGKNAVYHCMLTIYPGLKLLDFSGRKNKPVLDAETFTAFPYPPAEVPWGSDQATAKAWEALNGGTFFVEDSETLIFLTDASELYKARYYNYEPIGELAWVDYLFRDLSMIYVQLPDYSYLINPKFEALLAKEGFNFVEVQGRAQIFENKTKELKISIGAAYSPEEGDEAEYGVISFIHAPTGEAEKSVNKFANSRVKYSTER